MRKYIAGFVLGCMVVVISIFLKQEQSAPQTTIAHPQAYLLKNKLRPVRTFDHSTSFVDLSEDCKATLSDLQLLRKGRWHQKELNLAVDDEQSFIPEIASFFFAQQDKADFSQEEEWNRMMALDYLGEKWIGRLPTDFKEQIKQIFVNILKSDITTLSERKKKSMVGDKVEVMQYLSRTDQDFARTWLESQKGSIEYRYLETGFKNGLAFQKYP